MTYTDERVAAEMGRVLLAIYRAGHQIRVWPDPARGVAGARIMTSPSSRSRRSGVPASASGQGDSPLAAIYAAVQRLNEKAGAELVRLDD
jgi:hypothetical protein